MMRKVATKTIIIIMIISMTYIEKQWLEVFCKKNILKNFAKLA